MNLVAWSEEHPILAYFLFALVVVGGMVLMYWWAWPKDDDGRPLACTHYHSSTYLMPITVGNTVTYIPTQTEVCDAWASPSPRVKAG